MRHSLKNMRKQIIGFADSVVNPKDEGYVRGKRLTDKESQRMINTEYMQTEEKIDKSFKELLDNEYFKRIMQLNDKKRM